MPEMFCQNGSQYFERGASMGSEGCSLLLHVAARRFIFCILRSPFFSSGKFILVVDAVFIFLLRLFGLASASDSAVTAHKFIGCARHRRRYFKIFSVVCRPVANGMLFWLCSVRCMHNVLSASFYISVNFCSVFAAIYTPPTATQTLIALTHTHTRFQDCERDGANER